MDPDIEIMFVTSVGNLIPENKTTVHLSRHFNGRALPEHESSIETIWTNRLQENPRLFNGTKFRLDSVSSDSPGSMTMNVGLTDYREYLGTNWAPEVEKLRERGQSELSNPQTYMSDPMGVGAFVVTCDDCVIFLKRSMHCTEAPDMWDIPGGHSEPEELVGKLPIDQIDVRQMAPTAVAHEVFHSILREVRDEVNIQLEDLDKALLMGVARNVTSAGRPSVEFLVRCRLSKDEVLALYNQGSHAEADESTNIMLLPLTSVTSMQSENPSLWAQVAPSAKGCVLLYKLCHGL